MTILTLISALFQSCVVIKCDNYVNVNDSIPRSGFEYDYTRDFFEQSRQRRLIKQLKKDDEINNYINDYDGGDFILPKQ